MKDLDDDNRLQTDQLFRIPTLAPAPKQLLQPGDLIFRSRGQNNTAAVVHEKLERVILAAPLLLIRPRSNIRPAYLQWWINHPASQAALAEMAEGTSVRMISTESLRKLPVPLPPLETQQAIAELFSMAQHEQALLQRIAHLSRAWANQALLDVLHTDRSHPTGKPYPTRKSRMAQEKA